MNLFTRPSAHPSLPMNSPMRRWTRVAIDQHSLVQVGGLTVFLTMGLMTVSGYAHAQNINGIFGIRSSEQFFQAGIARLEDEINELVDGTDAEALSIDESVEQQRQDLQEDVPSSFSHINQPPAQDAN